MTDKEKLAYLAGRLRGLAGDWAYSPGQRNLFVALAVFAWPEGNK